MNARPTPLVASSLAPDRPTLQLPGQARGAPEVPPQPARLAIPGIPVHDARGLTGQSGQAQIVLDGQVYALRITRAGKLILTK